MQQGALFAFLLAPVADALQQTKVGQDTDIQKKDAAAKEEWAYSVGVQAYVFGLPLTILERERKIRLDPWRWKKPRRLHPPPRSINLGT